MAVADGFHVDSNGNLWLGSNRETFDATTRSEAPFYVYANGNMVANSGTFAGTLSSGISISAPVITGGSISGTSGSFTGSISGASGTFTGDLSGSDITGGTIDIGSGTFTVDSAGAMVATSATITGSITSTSGTIGGISINSGDIQANYSAGTTGFLIESDGDAFFNSVTVNNPIITLGKDTGSGTPTTAANDRIKIGDAVLFNRDVSGTSSLVTTKSLLVLPDGDEDNPSIAIDGQFATMGFFIDVPIAGQNRMQITNGTDNVASWDDFTDYFTVPNRLVLGGGLQAGGGLGNSGEVLQSTGSGVQWANASGSHADSDHTSFATTTSLNNHTGNSTNAHGYSAISINGLTMQHGYGLTIQGSGDIGVSSSGNPHTITISHDDSDHSYATGITSLSVSGGAGFAVTASQSGSSASINTTQSTTSTISTGTLNTYSHYPRSTDSYSIGTAGSRWLVGYFQFGTTTSDQRLKENIEDLTLGLDFINKLEPKKYNWKTEEYKYCEHCGCEFPMEATECGGDEHEDCDSPDNVLIIKNRREEISDIDMFGFMAQDVIAIDDLSDDNTYGIARHNTEEDSYDISYENMIAPLVKAVQELSAKNDELQSRIEELEG
jgi:hypothetical protein